MLFGPTPRVQISSVFVRLKSSFTRIAVSVSLPALTARRKRLSSVSRSE